MSDKLLEVSMMLGDAIKILDGLSAYKDPYAHLKEAEANGHTVQFHSTITGHLTNHRKGGAFNYPPDRYRIKPKTKTLYLFAYKNEDGEYEQTHYLDSEGDAIQEYRQGCDFHRLDYTAIEVEE